MLALPGFGYFSVEHAQSFHDHAKIFQPVNLALDKKCKKHMFEGLWNGTLVHYVCMFERFT